jgi:6,7-dimethyl-8-ribityllumazine synthase
MSRKPHILIVEAPYYQDLAAELRAGAIEKIEAAGATYEIVAVPGAFEIPAAIAHAAGLFLPEGIEPPQHYDGFLALGFVIRGETTHFDLVSEESARALQDLAVHDGLAIGYGILTAENDDQAWARALRTKKNKGAEAAHACLAMIDLKVRFGTTRA